jgi:hypothetical protein
MLVGLISSITNKSFGGPHGQAFLFTASSDFLKRLLLEQAFNISSNLPNAPAASILTLSPPLT